MVIVSYYEVIIGYSGLLWVIPGYFGVLSHPRMPGPVFNIEVWPALEEEQQQHLLNALRGRGVSDELRSVVKVTLKSVTKGVGGVKNRPKSVK